MTALLVALAAALLSERLTRALADPGSRLSVLDHPTERSLHAAPTPRGGGLAVVAAVLVCGTLLVALGASLAPDRLLGCATLGLIAIAAVSWRDDVAGLRPAVRLGVHFAAAALLVVGGLVPDRLVLPGCTLDLSPGAGVLLVALVTVWLVNLFNFMDGMDGFAGGMAVFGFGAFAVLGAAAGAPGFAGLALVVAGSAAGFLRHNFPPARIFLGDVGSCSLGYLAAAFALVADGAAIFPLWVAMLVLSPFVVDATVTLLRRLARREKVWEPHRTHYYQRMVGAGWSHRRTVLAEYALMTASSIAAWVAAQSAPGILAVGALAAATYAALALAVGHLERSGAPPR